MIPVQAVEAAARAIYSDGWDGAPYWESMADDNSDKIHHRAIAQTALAAAAPHMLSHEREQTRLAHLDAMVNRDTASRLEYAISGVLELAAPMRHMVAASEIREWIATALRPTP